MRGQVLETRSLELAKEIIRAKKLCQKEEEDCTDAETLQDSDDPEYEYDSEEEWEDSYESSFIDDDGVNEEASRRALNILAHNRRRKQEC